MVKTPAKVCTVDQTHDEVTLAIIMALSVESMSYLWSVVT